MAHFHFPQRCSCVCVETGSQKGWNILMYILFWVRAVWYRATNGKDWMRGNTNLKSTLRIHFFISSTKKWMSRVNLYFAFCPGSLWNGYRKAFVELMHQNISELLTTFVSSTEDKEDFYDPLQEEADQTPKKSITIVQWDWSANVGEDSDTDWHGGATVIRSPMKED